MKNLNNKCEWENCEETDVYRQATANQWFCLKHQHEYAHPKEGE